MKPEDKPLTRHHRKCRSNGGQTNDRNVVHVEQSKHQAWHTLFCNYHPEKIAHIINHVWLDPEFEFVVRRKP